MSGLNVNYTELFRLCVLQPFYQNGISAKNKVNPLLDYQVIPTKETSNLLNKLEFVLKRSTSLGGVTVFARTNGTLGSNKRLYFTPKPTDKLTFLISITNPDFLNHNNIFHTPGNNQVFYFNNLISDPAASKDNLHLSKADTGVDEVDKIEMESGVFKYTHPAILTDGSAKLKHQQSAQGIGTKTFSNQAGKAYLTFDLSKLPSGICELYIGSISTKTFYNLDVGESNSVFAIIELSLDALGLSNYRIVENDGTITPVRPKFTLLFNNRPTLWKYTIELEDKSPLHQEIISLTPSERANFFSKINVVSNDTGVTFTPGIVSDYKMEFVSNTALLLHEKYFSSSSLSNDPLKLSLKKYIGDLAKEADIKDNLPLPSSKQLDARGAPVIFSDILLNL